MIDYETFCKIRAYRENQGLKVAQIARALALHPCTVAKWVRTPQYRRQPTAPRRSKLGDRARPYRLLARPLGALHHRDRCDQYPRRRSLGRTTQKRAQ